MLQFPIGQILMQSLQWILPSGLSFSEIWLEIKPILFQYIVNDVESFADHFNSNFDHFILVLIQLEIGVVGHLALDVWLGLVGFQNVEIRRVKQVSLRNIALITLNIFLLNLLVINWTHFYY